MPEYGHTAAGKAKQIADELDDRGMKFIVLKSPNGTKWKIGVTNTGTIRTTEVV